MQIQSLNSSSIYRQKPTFKASYPVVHWLAETNGSYAPVLSEELTKTLPGKLVRILNNGLIAKKTPLPENVVRAYNYVKSLDTDFQRMSVVRSFYNGEGNLKSDKFEPISYMITGNDVTSFENALAKPIGRSMREAPVLGGKPLSGELNMALGDYWSKGLNFVKNGSKKFVDKDGIPNELHTKFRIIRTKTGKIKGYELVGIKFLPSKGPTNPFERLGYTKP